MFPQNKLNGYYKKGWKQGKAVRTWESNIDLNVGEAN